MADPVGAALAAARNLVDVAARYDHEYHGAGWGTDRRGIHGHEPGDPYGCDLCEAIDAARDALAKADA